MHTTSWHYKLFCFHLSSWISKMWRGKKKIHLLSLNPNDKGPGTSFCLPNRNKNKLEMFCITDTNIWTSFSLILFRMLKKQSKEVYFLMCSNVNDDITHLEVLQKAQKSGSFEKKTFLLPMKKVHLLWIRCHN